ncbi:hypothetical protein ACVK1X_002894 [Pseudomonas sp. PvR086]
MKSFDFIAAITMRIFKMFRRITKLIPLLALLTLSGCIIFPTAGMAATITTVTDTATTSVDNVKLLS